MKKYQVIALMGLACVGVIYMSVFVLELRGVANIAFSFGCGWSIGIIGGKKLSEAA